jgi:branched-chain amino acid transport system ATP-binding protein
MAAVLSVRGLSKRFGSLQAAREVDLDLEAGARVGLIGPNGAGKTTLVNLLTGVVAPDSGEIDLDGLPIARLAPDQRVRRGLVRTHQITSLIGEMSARDNVALAVVEREGFGWRMFGYSRQWRGAVEEADARLAEMGLTDVAGRPAAQIAYGRQRLLEIVIALALKPRVLLLDEPAAGVQSREAGAIRDQLARLPGDVAILMIEHDMDLVFRFAREIVVLVQGGVLTRGAPAAIAADERVRSVYLGRSAP